MGLFDRFKKKKDTSPLPSDTPPTSGSDDYSLLYRYRAYIVRFLQFQLSGNYAPIAAYERPDGSLEGYLFIAADDSYNLPVSEVVARMQTEMSRRVAAAEIASYIILYHGYNKAGHTAIADNEDGFKLIAIETATPQQGKTFTLPYDLDHDGISYSVITGLTEAQSSAILQGSIPQDKEYFGERVPVQAPQYTSPAGIVITKANEGDLSNTWGGIFGFESYRKPDGAKALYEYTALVKYEGAQATTGPVTVYKISGPDISVKVAAVNGNICTVLPVIETRRAFSATTKSIREWEHVQDTEAIIQGSGRDTFGITYYATDYALRKEEYKAAAGHRLRLSGILYVLDLYEPGPAGDGPQYADNFCGYFPNEQLAGQGCFDFIGTLESHRSVHALGGAVEGHMLLIRLINEAADPDFFTIEMFVHKENVRPGVPALRQGLQLTGMFQLQGCLDD